MGKARDLLGSVVAGGNSFGPCRGSLRPYRGNTPTPHPAGAGVLSW